MARLNRWWPDLFDGLVVAYDDPVAVGARVVELAARSFAARADELHALDLRRTLEPDWFQQPRAFGYAAYVDRFAGTLAGVGRRVGYLRQLGVTYLHLMPLLFPRAQPNDGGYAVVDYRRVRPDLGDTDDLRSLTTRLREEGISLCLDLVLNHVAREHEWARAARAGDPRYRAYFHIYPDRSAPDAFEASLPEVFPTFSPGSFTWDEDLRSWVWTTFNSYQWDVAWSNPDVFCEYADLIMWLANVGVEIVRLDAIAFIWKRLGTNCQNQPEVHALTQALRALTKIACPALIFKAEAIVGPRDLAGYLGTGERYGKVSDLAYHNNLMVQIWSMLASRDVQLAAQALQAIPQLPANTAWVTYVRCHDDIGWAIDDADAAAVGLTGPGHRRFLSDFYSGSFPGSFARGLVFQSNNATGDRRVCGTLASLAGLEAAEQDGDADAVAAAVARILLVHALILGWGGLPMLWMGDELGLLNDPDWAHEPVHAEDTRWVHRPRMPWSLADRLARAPQGDGAGSSAVGTTDPPFARVYRGLRRLIRTRASLPQLHAGIGAHVLSPSDPGVLLVLRAHPVGPLLAVYNVTESWRPVPAFRLAEVGLDPSASGDRIQAQRIEAAADEAVWLPPYAAWWITAV